MNNFVYDLRSDTVTKPTAEMIKSISQAILGDDVLEEDPTVKELEELSAEITGKEASLLVPSGTFGNQLAILTHCSQGDEIYLSDFSHVIEHEVGGASVIASVQTRSITPSGAWPTWEEIEPKIRKHQDIHYPEPRLIEVENALPNGTVQPISEMIKIKKGAEKYKLKVHLDGARIFNAAIALKLRPCEIAEQCDSVMFCLSKGLCAPIGSILAGTKEFISRARKNRKIMGGGMRQAGVIAAPGIIALRKMTERLEEDHIKASHLSELFQEYPSFFKIADNLEINMVFVQVLNSQKETLWLENLKENNILTYPPENGWIRFVFHHDIPKKDTPRILSKFKKSIEEVFN